MQASTKLTIRPARISVLPEPPNGELSDLVVRQCDFCGKDVNVTATSGPALIALSGPDAFFCCYCLQNGLHTRLNRNVLIMSYRAVFGYFYLEYYATQSPNPRRRMAYSQIEDYIIAHEEASLQNPLFRYDPETYYWFVDFNRVGRTGRSLRVDDVKRTVLNTLACFNLWENVPSVQMASFYRKFDDAIRVFHERRFRPEGRRALIPTLSGCGPVEASKSGLFDKTRAFTRAQFQLK